MARNIREPIPLPVILAASEGKVALEKALKQIRGAASGKNMEIVSGQLVPKESVKL